MTKKENQLQTKKHNNAHKKNQSLAEQLHQFNKYTDSQTRNLLSRIRVQRSMVLGFLIHQEEIKRGINFQQFYSEISESLRDLGCRYHSRTLLFESRRLYSIYARFTKVINNKLSIENISIPLSLSKKHLLKIASKCKDEETQDIFINKVIERSLTVDQLVDVLNVEVSDELDVLLIVDNLKIKNLYDFNSLEIKMNWLENEIKKHIVSNISLFIKIVLDADWGFYPDQSAFSGGKIKYPDLVFYNSTTHRYLIVDLKIKSSAASIDRAKSQMASYMKAYDQKIDLSFQKRTIGLILCKEPLEKDYFNSTSTQENMFYSGFSI